MKKNNAIQRPNKGNNLQKGNEDKAAKTFHETSMNVFFNLSREIMFSLNGNKEILLVNETWEKQLGYSATESLNRKLADFIYKDDSDKTNEFLDIYLAGKTANSVSLRFITHSSSVMYLKLNVVLNAGILYCCAENATETLELEEQLYQSSEKFQHILDQIPVRIVWKNTNLEIIGCNKAFLNVAGFTTQEEIIGKTDFDMPWKDQAAEYMAFDKHIIENDEAKLDYEEETTVNGKYLVLKKSKIPLHDRENKVIGIICSYENITNKKKEENQLRESENRFRTLFEDSIDAIALSDANGIHLHVNASYLKLFRYQKESEILGKPLCDLISEENREFVHDLIVQRAQNKKAPNIYEVWGQRKDNSKFVLNIHANSIDTNGVRQTLLILRDITERIELVKKLQQSEIKYRTIANNAYNWEFWAAEPDHYEYVSTSCERITGYTAEEFLTDYSLMLKIVHPEDKQKYYDHTIYAKTEKKAGQITFRIINKNGSVHWIDHVCTPAFDDQNNFIGTRGSNRDITEKRNISEKLRDREATLSALFNAITEVAILIDINGKVITANQTAANRYNATIDEVIGANVFEYFEPDVAEDRRHYFNEARLTRKPVRFENVYNNIINDMTIYPVFNPEGEVFRYVIFGVDITQKREAISAFRERDFMLSALINATTESAFLIENSGKILFANETVAKRFGTTVDDFIGQYLFDLVAFNVAFEIKKYCDFVFQTGKPARFENNLGDAIIDNSVYPVFNDKGEVTLLAVFGSDITKRKQAEEQINKMHKKLLDSNSSKDKFFSIIAHDLRSPFQGLLGYSQLLYEDYDALTEDERKQYIQNIGEISKNSYKLLENLLQWSRMQTGNFEFNPEVLNLAEELKPTIDLLKQTASNKEISVISMIKPKTYVMADRNMIDTIVRNLVSNSIKFTRPQGTVTISSGELNNFVLLSVKDNGVGMDAEKMQYLFKAEKNISTVGTAKERGTGLGLLLCKEMVEKHNGEIWVESEKDKGSTFYFTLPKRM